MQILLLVENKENTKSFAITDDALPLLDATEAANRLRLGETDRIEISSSSLLQLWLTPSRNAIDGMIYNHLAEAIEMLAAAQHAANQPGATLVLTIHGYATVIL